MTVKGDKSKRRSESSLPRESLVFFVDRSLGRMIIPEALRAAEARVELHDDHFPQNAPDQTWLTEAGQRGWVVLTKDKHLRYRAVETNALMLAKVRAFVLTARGDLSGAEIGRIFVRALPAMRKLCMTLLPPFVAHVSRDGKVAVVKT